MPTLSVMSLSKYCVISYEYCAFQTSHLRIFPSAGGGVPVSAFWTVSSNFTEPWWLYIKESLCESRNQLNRTCDFSLGTSGTTPVPPFCQPSASTTIPLPSSYSYLVLYVPLRVVVKVPQL